MRRRRVESDEIRYGVRLYVEQPETGFGSRHHQRCGAEGAMLEAAPLRRALIGCRVPCMLLMVMVVLCVVCMAALLADLRQPGGRKCRWAERQEERPAGRGHEARWNQRAQQEREKHEVGDASAFSSAENRGTHTERRSYTIPIGAGRKHKKARMTRAWLYLGV